LLISHDKAKAQTQNRREIMKKSILIICIFTLFQTSIAFAGSPYIRESIGKEEKKLEENKEKDLFPYRPVSSWKGERFIFLPKEKKWQDIGYVIDFYDEDGKKLWPLNYNEYFGRIAQVISVDQEKKKIKLKMEDNSKILILSYIGDVACMVCLALVSDIDNARKKWLGKTLLYNTALYPDTYYDIGNVTGIKGRLPVKKNTPLKVIDIVGGWEHSRPVRFILKTPSGKECYVDVSLSGTNSCGNPYRQLKRYGLDQYFSVKLPKKSLKPPKQTSVTSCYKLGYLYGRCATRSMTGLSCEPGTDIVIPEHCRGEGETQSGIEAGIKSVSE
jgi:hypothetical protein